MLNTEKIGLYRKYAGDIDGFARAGDAEARAVITDDDWFLIDSLVQKLFLVKSGRASPEFSRQLLAEVRRHTENEAAADELMRLA